MLNFILDSFSGFSERAKLFLVVFFTLLIYLPLVYFLGGWWATQIVFIPALIGVLQVTKAIWYPNGERKIIIPSISLGVAALVVFSGPFWKKLADSQLSHLYERLPFLEGVLHPETPSTAALVFIAAVIFIVNYLMRDKSAMKEHSTPLAEEFPEKGYPDLLQSFANLLKDDLNKIDRETNWSAEIFTPLDAEVEVKSGSKRLKKITDLISAIRSDRESKVFLVLGVPGSGKSVALRKLCRDLLDEVKRTGKVPIYVNLREWDATKPWTEENPPTVQELYDFVIENLKSRGDVFSTEFLDKYFRRMFDHGRLFIVLDSFDEIPAVMDENENSWLVDSLSDVIYRFLTGMNESRGILASRIFRRPTDRFDSKTTFEIRPFTESKIVDALSKSMFYDESLVRRLFNERQEFIPVARNPFTAALISSYAKDNGNDLPKNQAELYSDYISRRLDACAERIAKVGLTKARILEAAVEIADVMLSNESLGLEATIDELREKIHGKPIEKILGILKFARLGRLGGGNEQRFSFVHRRFNEYFVVQKLIDNPQTVAIDSIPTDSRWRDALVLYCEVAEEKEAREIAGFCWSEIKKLQDETLNLSDPQYLRSIHCLRFLKEAFRARLECIYFFRAELSDFVLQQIDMKNNNILAVKLAVEAVGLLDEVDMDKTLVNALKLDNHWISETSVKSCNYLPSLSDNLNRGIIDYLSRIDSFSFYLRRQEITYPFRLSAIFCRVKDYCEWRIIDFYVVLFAVLLCFTLFPIASFVSLVISIFYFILFISLEFLLPIAGAVPYWSIFRQLFSAFTLMQIVVLSREVTAYFESHLQHPPDLRFLAFHRKINFFSDRSLAFDILILIVLALLFVPWQYIFYQVLPSIRNLKPKLVLLFCCNIAVGLTVILGVFWFLSFLITLYGLENVFIIGVYIVTIIALLLLVRFGVVRRYVSLYKDLVYLRQIKKSVFSNRKQLADCFNKFITSPVRLEYIKYLEIQGIKPTGSWPEGKIPNINNDRASTLLAQLEEKWLGLDR